MPERVEFSLTHKAAMAAFLALSVAFEVVLENAVPPDRADSDGEARSARLAELRDQALRRMKNVSTEGISEIDEAAGIATAIAVIEDIGERLRKAL